MTLESRVADPAVVNAYFVSIPPSWRQIERGIDGGAFQRGDVRVIASVAVEGDGELWIHVSASTVKRIPTWDEFKRVKTDFLGDRYAYQVLPPAAKYINIHPHVLHLFARLDGKPVLPDFTGGSDSL